jgi:phosphate uptake regulator
METRKVQLSGGTTYTISLPKSWAQEHGIDAGSVLSLFPNSDGSLLIEAGVGESSDERSTEIDVSTDSESAIRQWIHALHAIGFDTVTLVDRTGHSPEQRNVIENTVGNLSGFELMEATDTRIRLTDLIDAENVNVRKSALRLRLVVLGMHRDAVSAVLTQDETLAQRVIERDNGADKLFAMVTRHFRRALTNLQEVEKLESDRDELFEYYYISRQFERIADHAEKVAHFAFDPEATIPAAFEERIDALAKDSRQVIDTASDAILADAGVEGAHTAFTKRDTLMTDIRSFDRELYTHDDPAEAYMIGLLIDSIRRSAEYGANIAGTAIQQTARKSEYPE